MVTWSPSGPLSPVADPAAPSPSVVRKQMGLRPPALLAGVKALPAPTPWQPAGAGALEAGDDSTGKVHVRVEALPDRHLGRLHLPASHVTITFTGVSQPQRDAFLKAFEDRFQRGGG